MNVNQSLSGAQFIAALSSLGSANRQPQLALELITSSVSAAQQVAGAAQSPPQPAAGPIGQSRAPGAPGSVIDAYA